MKELFDGSVYRVGMTVCVILGLIDSGWRMLVVRFDTRDRLEHLRRRMESISEKVKRKMSDIFYLILLLFKMAKKIISIIGDIADAVWRWLLVHFDLDARLERFRKRKVRITDEERRQAMERRN